MGSPYTGHHLGQGFSSLSHDCLTEHGVPLRVYCRIVIISASFLTRKHSCINGLKRMSSRALIDALDRAISKLSCELGIGPICSW